MYNLHKLGWHSFQQLCLSVLRENLGQTVESFLDSNDGGRDGAFSGRWNSNGGDNLTGRFVFQCKFTVKQNHLLKASELKEELQKVERLVAENRCDCYILLTNAGLSGNSANEIEKLYLKAGVKQFRIYGSTWLTQQIQESKRLRMLVPRVYGLGDLSQILDERAYSQARAMLASLKDDLSKIVITSAYQRAADALNEHGFVLLIGEPAAGKTTIASLLAMAALDQWGASTLKVDDSDKMVARWNPDEPSQFFWIDDAFGVTQYESNLTYGWNHKITQIKTMLRQGVKIVMTSRDYIYNRARKDLKESAFPLLQESKVVIDVHRLSAIEKRQILYNHLKLGRQLKDFVSEIKPFLDFIADQPRFVPETARRLSEPIFTKSLVIAKSSIESFVNKQEGFLQEVLDGLDQDCKAALALIYMRNDKLVSPIELLDAEQTALSRLGSNLGGCTIALDSMKDSIVQLSHFEGATYWKYKHPTIGDAYSILLVNNPELLGIYVQGTNVDKLIGQVTCGDVGIERAIIIPKVLFPLMLQRLNDFSDSKKYKSKYLSKWKAKDSIDSFLSYRCSKEFLSIYLEARPDVLNRISSPGLYLSAVSEVSLAIKLHDYGLLPEVCRKKFITAVSSYAIEGDDLYAITSKSIRPIFTDDEFDDLNYRLENELIPNLDNIRHNAEVDFSSDKKADDHMDHLLDSLSTLKMHFKNDIDIVMSIDKEIQKVNEWVDENSEDEPEISSREKLEEIDISNDFDETRSIFDDIDIDEE